MITLSRISMLWSGLLLLLFSYGCSGYSLKYYNRPETDIKSLSRLAVIPLSSLTTDLRAGEKVSLLLITELLSRGIDVVEPGEVTRALRDANIRQSGLISKEDAKKLGAALKVDAFISGAVEAYTISKGVNASYPEVSLSLMLIETKSGRVIWSVWHTSGGAGFFSRHFGTEGPTLSEAAARVVKEAVDTLEIIKQ